MQASQVSRRYCRSCDKQGYVSQRDAMLMQQWYRVKYGWANRVYECPVLDLWHMTTKNLGLSARKTRRRKAKTNKRYTFNKKMRPQIDTWENEGGSYRE